MNQCSLLLTFVLLLRLFHLQSFALDCHIYAPALQKEMKKKSLSLIFHSATSDNPAQIHGTSNRTLLLKQEASK